MLSVGGGDGDGDDDGGGEAGGIWKEVVDMGLNPWLWITINLKLGVYC